MYQKVKAYVAKHHMLENSDKVLVGVSGGADSVCLLFMLLRLREEMGLALLAVHVHHGLRGEYADADAKFVQSICSANGVELKICYEDAGTYARKYRLTVEEAGRELRRKRFEEILAQWGGTRIALAHHQNDNAETLLWNLCRGTGLRGIGGMLPKNGIWIRPVLCLKRQEVESYLGERGISYCTDETNLTDDHTRNRIRNHVLPYLEGQVNEKSVEHMNRTMEQMRLLQEYVDEQATLFQGESVRKMKQGSLLLMEKKYTGIALALKPYVLHKTICMACGTQKNIAAIHVEAVHSLFDKQVGRQVDLPYGLTAVRCYEGIRFDKYKREEPKQIQQIRPKYNVFEKSKEMSVFPQTPYTKWFDYDIIKNTVEIRHREPGDFITIDKNGGTQKLKKYFINSRIPQEERDELWLAADGHHIMWIIGYRQNQSYQITDQTRTILEIDITEEESDGGNS